jgi:hypothetical protein
VRLHGFAFLADDLVNVRIRPAFGDYFRAHESPRLRNPVVRFIRFNRSRYALTGRDATARKLLGDFSRRAFDELGLRCHGLSFRIATIAQSNTVKELAKSYDVSLWLGQYLRYDGNMTVLDQVRDLIIRRAPACVCDDCIADELHLSVRQHANHKTRELAKMRGFDRREGRCARCAGDKKVIRYAPRC